MRRTLITSSAILALLTGMPAQAQEHMDHSMHSDHSMHMMDMGNDQRQLVNFPPEMRQHTLSNMRDHLAALSEILDAMATAHYAKAAHIASTRLGLASPSAAGCKPAPASDAPMMSKPGDMDHQMARFMPEGMRNIGLEMHTAASDFAAKALKANGTHNAQPALAALSRVMQQCAACHATYKVM
jgi:hypothetical protein